MTGSELADRQSAPSSAIGWGVLLIAASGLLLRFYIAWSQYPTFGDPLYSYCYRAELIAAGDWRGVFLMWHPPGYPLTLAALTAMAGGVISPYTWGLVVTFVSYAVFIWLADRLAKKLLHESWARLCVASFVAFQETLVRWQGAPLTEPPYLAIMAAAILLISRDELKIWPTLLAGMLAGWSCSMRLEALGPTAALGLCLLYRAVRLPDGDDRRPTWLAVISFGVGVLLSAGWLLVQFDYLQLCRSTQEYAFAVPPAHGIGGNIKRLIAAGYIAMTEWLPAILLLPFWLICGLSLVARLPTPHSRRIMVIVVAIFLGSMALVVPTIMHKRTGTLLLLPLALGFGIGADVLIGRFRTVLSARVLVAMLVLLNLGQAGRLFLADVKESKVSLAVAELLRETNDPAGPLWFFGNEPEVYAYLRQTHLFPFFDRSYRDPYRLNVGNPAAFVGQLRERGFRYLAFHMTDGDSTAPVVQDLTNLTLTRAEFQAIESDPQALGLQRCGNRVSQLNGGVPTRVYLYRVVH